MKWIRNTFFSKRGVWPSSVLILILCLGSLVLRAVISEGAIIPGEEAIAALATTVRVSPSSQTIPVEDTTTVDITIEDVTDLYGYELHLSFTASVLEVQSIQRGSFLPSGGWEAQNTYNNDAGTIDYTYSLMGAPSGEDGDGVLLQITFRGKAGGTGSIQFTTVKLSDSNANSISHSTAPGSITVAALTTCKILLPLISRHYP